MDLKEVFRFVSPQVHEAAVKTAAQLMDIIELIKVGADVKRARDYIQQYAGDLAPRFEELVNEAISE